MTSRRACGDRGAARNSFVRNGPVFDLTAGLVLLVERGAGSVEFERRLAAGILRTTPPSASAV